MAKKPGEKTADSGLELDKINLSSFASGNDRDPMSVENPGIGIEDPGVGVEGSAAGASGKKQPATEDMPENKRKTNLALISVLAILVLLMAFTAFFKQQDYSFTFLPEKSGTSQENYLRVGPVTATLANEDIVIFSIDIDCGNVDQKERLAEKDTQIRDKIVAVLTSPGTDELIKNRDYDAIKAKIKKTLGDIGSGTINDIYFAELLMY